MILPLFDKSVDLEVFLSGDVILEHIPVRHDHEGVKVSDQSQYLLAVVAVVEVLLSHCFADLYRIAEAALAILIFVVEIHMEASHLIYDSTVRSLFEGVEDLNYDFS